MHLGSHLAVVLNCDQNKERISLLTPLLALKNTQNLFLEQNVTQLRALAWEDFVLHHIRFLLFGRVSLA